MVNYDKTINSGGGDGAGTMRISDNGSVVEFWINSNDPWSFNYDWPWGYTVNGKTDNTREFRYSAGAGWQKVGSWTVTYDQTVTFRVRENNAGNLSGPQTHSVNIQRATKPNPPGRVSLSSITSNSVYAKFTDGSDNGADIDDRVIGYGTSSSSPQAEVDGNARTISGLASGRKYYFWGRTHNSKGWSDWGPRSDATTLRVPDAPKAPTISSITQVSVVAKFSDGGNGGTAITDRQIGYGTSTSGPQTTLTGNNKTITGLQPGVTYYFWSRTRNSVGWSPWSSRSQAMTLVGAYVKVGSTWKRAIPYVRQGGVWKLAKPMVRIGGQWKDTY